jgi:hypothetical protein
VRFFRRAGSRGSTSGQRPDATTADARGRSRSGRHLCLPWRAASCRPEITAQNSFVTGLSDAVREGVRFFRRAGSRGSTSGQRPDATTADAGDRNRSGRHLCLPWRVASCRPEKTAQNSFVTGLSDAVRGGVRFFRQAGSRGSTSGQRPDATTEDARGRNVVAGILA